MRVADMSATSPSVADAGVGDHDVQPAVGRRACAPPPGRRCPGSRRSATTYEPRGGLGQLDEGRLVPADADHRDAACGEGTGDAEADALAGAGHDGHRAVERSGNRTHAHQCYSDCTCRPWGHVPHGLATGERVRGVLVVVIPLALLAALLYSYSDFLEQRAASLDALKDRPTVEDHRPRLVRALAGAAGTMRRLVVDRRWAAGWLIGTAALGVQAIALHLGLGRPRPDAAGDQPALRDPALDGLQPARAERPRLPRRRTDLRRTHRPHHRARRPGERQP